MKRILMLSCIALPLVARVRVPKKPRLEQKRDILADHYAGPANQLSHIPGTDPRILQMFQQFLKQQQLQQAQTTPSTPAAQPTLNDAAMQKVFTGFLKLVAASMAPDPSPAQIAGTVLETVGAALAAIRSPRRSHNQLVDDVEKELLRQMLEKLFDRRHRAG